MLLEYKTEQLSLYEINIEIAYKTANLFIKCMGPNADFFFRDFDVVLIEKVIQFDALITPLKSRQYIKKDLIILCSLIMFFSNNVTSNDCIHKNSLRH